MMKDLRMKSNQNEIEKRKNREGMIQKNQIMKMRNHLKEKPKIRLEHSKVLGFCPLNFTKKLKA